MAREDTYLQIRGHLARMSDAELAELAVPAAKTTLQGMLHPPSSKSSQKGQRVALSLIGRHRCTSGWLPTMEHPSHMWKGAFTDRGGYDSGVGSVV